MGTLRPHRIMHPIPESFSGVHVCRGVRAQVDIPVVNALFVEGVAPPLPSPCVCSCRRPGKSDISLSQRMAGWLRNASLLPSPSILGPQPPTARHCPTAEPWTLGATAIGARCQRTTDPLDGLHCYTCSRKGYRCNGGHTRDPLQEDLCKPVRTTSTRTQPMVVEANG
jgi:hypothetical protein